MDETIAMTVPRDRAPAPPRLLAAIGAIVLYFLIQLATGIVVGVVFVLAHMGTGNPVHAKALMHDPQTRILLVAVTLPISCMLSILVFRAWFGRLWHFGDNIGVGVRPTSIAGFALQMLLGVATALCGGMLTYLLSRGHPPAQDIAQIMHHTPLSLRVLLALSTITVVPLVEEILFRGILLPSLIRHMPVVAATIVDASLFALMHLPDFHWKPQDLLALFLVGIVCCWRRLKTGSIYSSVAVHAGNNLLAMIFLVTAFH